MLTNGLFTGLRLGNLRTSSKLQSVLLNEHIPGQDTLLSQ